MNANPALATPDGLERLSARYEKHHESRSNDFVFGGMERIALFRRLVGGPARRVVDVGCRYGALTRHYLQGNEVVGVDVDREALAEVATLGVRPCWADADGRLPLDDASFDVFIAGELLEHLRDPGGLVAEAFRLLRPGGRAIASVPNAFRLKNRLRFLAGGPPDTDPTHLHLFSPGDLHRMFSAFVDVQLWFISSRLLRLSPRFFANDIVIAATKPDPAGAGVVRRARE